jgi:hypothetical protein
MGFRKLRVAWSVAWGIAAVLLVVLWVRSCWWHEQASYSTLSKTYFSIRSDNGYLTGFQGDFRPSRHTPGWLYTSGVTREDWHHFIFKWNSKYRIISLPHAAVAILFATPAIAPWLRWRFSLRTLLVATTLVAVVLGLIVWLR